MINHLNNIKDKILECLTKHNINKKNLIITGNINRYVSSNFCAGYPWHLEENIEFQINENLYIPDKLNLFNLDIREQIRDYLKGNNVFYDCYFETRSSGSDFNVYIYFREEIRLL